MGGAVLKFALATIAYREERMVGKSLRHIPDWIDIKMVLLSSKPWIGDEEPPDKTMEKAKAAGGTVIQNYWENEHTQRNTGQQMLEDYDWIITLDPDEFLDERGWDKLKSFLETADQGAYVCQHQRVFYKKKEVYPHTDYQQIIAVRPSVRFADKRVVNTTYGVAPVELYHFSWRRTNQEILSKIKHYSHAHEFDVDAWYRDVWLTDRSINLHPLTPETLSGLIDSDLPPELKSLGLDKWKP